MTDLASLYRYADFTHEAYRTLLADAKAAYPFLLYSEIEGQERFLLWRHDVDASMHEAVALARIEAEMGVRATYFLLPGCVHYNLFEPAIVSCMREIRALGHAFGLHFDASSVENEHGLMHVLAREKSLLEAYCERPIEAFSFHNPTLHRFSFDALTAHGMVNCYAPFFRDTVAYVSDSNGIWRHGSIADTLAQSPARLQVLTHPEWWTDKPMSPRERIVRGIEGRARATLAGYNHALRMNDRPNIGVFGTAFDTLADAWGPTGLRIHMLWLSGEQELAFTALGLLLRRKSITGGWQTAYERMVAGEPLDATALEEAMREALRSAAAA